MRFHGVVLLAAVALLSSVHGRARGIAKINAPAIADPLFADAPTKRILRTDNPEKKEGEGEDRAGWNLFKKSELKAWLDEGTTADTALMRLNQNTRVHNSVNDPGIKKLVKFVSMYNERFGTQVSTVATLTGRYTDEAIAATIQAGMKSRNPKTKALAEKLEGEQFRLWGISENTPPRRIFAKLNLVKRADNEAFRVMSGDAYQAFKRYLDVYNHRNPGHEVSEFQVFQKIYSDSGLALLISQAKLDPNQAISSAALGLRGKQFEDWHTKSLRPSDVYRKVFNVQADDARPVLVGIVNDYNTWIRVGSNIRRGH